MSRFQGFMLYPWIRGPLTNRKKGVIALAVLLALSGTALAADAWVGNMGYMGQPPGASEQSMGSGVTGKVQCYPIDYGGGCTNIFTGSFASSGNIQTLDAQVYSLQQQLAQDISWLGYYTARTIRNSATARSIAELQAGSQVPANMPCGSNSCTSQADVADDIAGSGGAFGVDNPVSGKSMAQHQVDAGLLTQHTTSSAATAWNQHNQYFCTQNQIAAGMCASNATVSQEPDADVEGVTLLAGHGIQPLQHPNLEATARALYIQNITDNMPVPAIAPNAYKTEAGRLAVGYKLEYQAKMNLAQSALDQINALHTLVPGLGTSLNATVRGLGMPTVPANISLNQYLAYMQRAQYGNPKWYVNLSQLSGVALQREQAIMQAQQLQFQYIAYKQRTALVAMQAANLAQETQAEFRRVANAANNSLSQATSATAS